MSVVPLRSDVMDVSLVLRGASCWDAWAEAMNILKRMRIDYDTAKEWLEKAGPEGKALIDGYRK